MKILIFVFLFLGLPLLVSNQAIGVEKSFRYLSNKAFSMNEVLEFKMHYGWINAGIASIKIANDPVKINNRNCLHVIGQGKSINTFDWFFKVRDTYETYMDMNAMMPWKFKRDITEGGFSMKEEINFDHFNNKAVSPKTEISIPEYVQDLISAFYYARNIDYSDAKAGDIYNMNVYLDDQVYPVGFKFIGRETIKTDLGKFRVMVFRPKVLSGRVFKNEEDMTVYVSDDANKLPIEIKANILVGSIKMTLTGYKNLKNPVTSRISKD